MFVYEELNSGRDININKVKQPNTIDAILLFVTSMIVYE